jgi:hypothetical protein
MILLGIREMQRVLEKEMAVGVETGRIATWVYEHHDWSAIEFASEENSKLRIAAAPLEMRWKETERRA